MDQKMIKVSYSLKSNRLNSFDILNAWTVNTFSIKKSENQICAHLFMINSAPYRFFLNLRAAR